MRTLRGKRALVTGAASGIGRAIALELAREGVDLYLVDIDELGLNETASEARQSGVEVVARHCNVANPAEVSATVAACLSSSPPRSGEGPGEGQALETRNLDQCRPGPDILINNAGITYYGRTEEMAPDHWDRLLQINLLSHIQFTRELLPSLLEREESHVLNVCSILGLVGMPKVTAYCASKFGMVGFSESLRNEYARQGLGVTALCPGFVRTNLFTNAPLAEGAEAHKLPPKIICTTPERVARAAVKAIRRNRRLVVMEPFARFMYAVKRFAPWALDLLFRLGRRKHANRKPPEQTPLAA